MAGFSCSDDVSFKSICVKECGNGKRASSEECDDGNNENGDGCSSVCKNEAYFQCIGGSITSRDKCFKQPFVML